MPQHYHGHRTRLRERLNRNPHEMQDYEILELLLATVIIRKDTKPLAKELLSRFQTLQGVIDAKPAELTAIPGFGPALTSHWLLLRELMARYAASPLRHHEKLVTTEEIAKIARTRLAALDHEEVWLAFVDSKNRLLAWEFYSKGSIHASSVYIRDILERGITLKASGFIIVHNHPGGDSAPSGADLENTAALKRAANSVELRFIDHVIVSDQNCYSIAQEGLL